MIYLKFSTLKFIFQIRKYIITFIFLFTIFQINRYTFKIIIFTRFALALFSLTPKPLSIDQSKTSEARKNIKSPYNENLKFRNLDTIECMKREKTRHR